MSKKKQELGLVALAFNHNTQKTKEGRFLWVPVQPGQHSKNKNREVGHGGEHL